jgi:hypothetical protein
MSLTTDTSSLLLYNPPRVFEAEGPLGIDGYTYLYEDF